MPMDDVARQLSGNGREAGEQCSPGLCDARCSSVLLSRSRSFSAALAAERLQRAANVAFAQALEGAVAKLAYPFARDAEHGTDFLKRVLAAALETEVQAQHLGVARRERAERLLDLVGEEAVHRLLFR